MQPGEENAVIYRFLPKGKNQNVQHSWEGRTYVLPEEFLLAGWAGSGDKLPQLSLVPEWALPRGGKNIFFKS